MKIKLIKRFLCMALAILMVLAIVACGAATTTTDDDDDDDDEDEDVTTTTKDPDDDSVDPGTTTNPGDDPVDPGTTTPPVTTDPPVTTTTENRIDDLPEVDFGGEEIVVYSRVQSYNANSFDAKYDGDVVNNAVYQRNSQLKKRLNCTIRYYEEAGDTNDTTVYDTMLQLKETPTYHIVTTNSFRMTQIAAEGLLHDLACMQYVDLNKDYYDDGYNAALNVGGRQYLVSGKLTISWYRYQIVTIFNRNMFQANNVDYLYDTVLDGEWTTEKMMETARAFYSDDGDAIYNNADQFGYYVCVGDGSSQTDGFMGAFNLRLVQKDELGYMKKIEIDPTPWVDAMNDFLDMLGTEACWAGTIANGDSNTSVENKFINAQTAMITYRMYIVESDQMVALSRDREGYGIVPLPMANEEQEDYVSYVQDQVLCLGIPYTMVDDSYEMAQIFLEAFASESYNTTMPAYYERALTKKYVYDEASKEMIKIIDSNVIVDPVNVYNSMGFNTTGLRKVYSGEKVVSDILGEKILGEESSFDTKIAEFNQKYMDLDAKLTVDGYENAGNIITEVDG